MTQTTSGAAVGSFEPLAAALRQCSQIALHAWEQRVRRDMPQLTASLSSDELRANLPNILADLADAVARPEPGARPEPTAAEGPPSRGLRRFHQGFELKDVLASTRHLWWALTEALSAALGRNMEWDEVARLRDAFDAAMDSGLLAYANCEEARMRAAAEAELRRLAFLAHDVNNTLTATRLWLVALTRRLKMTDGFTEEVELAERTQASIGDTVHGMRQLLEHERLRRAGVGPELRPVALAEVASHVAAQFAADARDKGLMLALEVNPEAVVDSDQALLSTILRNLIGNAVKYAQRGRIRIASEYRHDGDGRAHWTLAVSDQGPGIGPECLDHIFEDFRRGPTAEPTVSDGVGLGLAIARQAASVLSVELAVESQVGVGSTFRLRFPPRPA